MMIIIIVRRGSDEWRFVGLCDKRLLVPRRTAQRARMTTRHTGRTVTTLDEARRITNDHRVITRHSHKPILFMDGHERSHRTADDTIIIVQLYYRRRVTSQKPAPIMYAPCCGSNILDTNPAARAAPLMRSGSISCAYDTSGSASVAFFSGGDWS